jgi:DNA-binding Lrp family transcriptional regulator
MERILDLLRQDARLSAADIATRIGLTEPVVAARIQQLEKEGVILGYHTVLDHEKIGPRGVIAYIEVKVTPESGGGFDRFARRVSQYDQVRGCYLMSGGYDIGVVIEGKDLYDVARFVAEKPGPRPSTTTARTTTTSSGTSSRPATSLPTATT